MSASRFFGRLRITNGWNNSYFVDRLNALFVAGFPNPPLTQLRSFSLNAQCLAKWNRHNTGPQKWLQYNKIIHPPQEPHEEPRKAVSS